MKPSGNYCYEYTRRLPTKWRLTTAFIGYMRAGFKSAEWRNNIHDIEFQRAIEKNIPSIFW
jgi:hypothetical protein